MDYSDRTIAVFTWNEPLAGAVAARCGICGDVVLLQDAALTVNANGAAVVIHGQCAWDASPPVEREAPPSAPGETLVTPDPELVAALRDSLGLRRRGR